MKSRLLFALQIIVGVLLLAATVKVVDYGLTLFNRAPYRGSDIVGVLIVVSAILFWVLLLTRKFSRR